MSYKLPADTKIGAVSLTITDLERSIAYYQKLGLTVRQRDGETAVLGTPTRPLLTLHQNRTAQCRPHTTGLYHFAFLVPTRLELAQAFKNMIDHQIPVGGASDHLVSEALYLTDPDGNGIEVYRDRPRAQWEYRPNGEMRIDTLPLDFENLLSELRGQQGGWTGFSDGTTMGHIHLHVGELEDAGKFYERLGFDFIARYGRSAQFLSAGGYHHHIGMNTWAGENIPPPPPNSVGLRHYEILLPEASDLDPLVTHLQQKSVTFQQDDASLRLEDPAGNHIVITYSSSG